MAAAPAGKHAALGFEVMSCAMSGEVEPVKQALLTKYHINSLDAASKGTVLHAVAAALALDQNTKDGHIELVKWLLEHGIDYSIRDEAGKTAEERLAEAKQHHEAKKALDIIKQWKERNSLADQEARRHNLHRDSRREKHDVQEAERLLRVARTLRVTVVRADGLPASDRNGLADPYCKLRYGALKVKEKKLMETMKPSPKPASALEHSDAKHHHAPHHLFARQKRHTKTVYKSLAPVWGETFDFEINRHKEAPKHAPPPHEAEDFLRVDVWDKDDVRDDFIGYVQLHLTDIVGYVAHGEAQRQFLLSPDKAGAVTLKFELA